MRNRRRGRSIRTAGAVLSAVVAVALLGCSKTTTCQLSPVELEELREDIAVLEKDLKTAKDREAQLSADLATKKADLESKKGKPAELRAQLDQVKRGAGKTEKPKEAPKPAPAPPKVAPKEPAKETPKEPAKEAPKEPAKEAPKTEKKG